MTKRILAVIMAIVMSLSVLSISAFASDWNQPQLSYDKTAKTMTITWNAHPSAAGYSVVLYKDGINVGQVLSLAKTVTTYTFQSITAGGTYEASVTASFTGSAPETITSNKVVVESVVTVGTVKVSSAQSGAIVEWAAVTNAAGYVIDYTYYDETSKTIKNGPSIPLTASTLSYAITGISYANLRTVSVSYQDSSLNKKLIQSVAVNGATTGTTTGTSTAQGVASIVGTTLYWTGYNAAYITIYAPTYSQYSPVLNKQYVTGTAFDFTSYASRYGTLYFYVYPPTNSSAAVGYATYNYNSTASSSYGISVGYLPTGNQVRVSWNPVANAASYSVKAVVNNIEQNYATTNTYYDLAYVVGNTAQITVYAVRADGYTFNIIGQASIAANGAISYSNYNAGYGYGNGLYPNLGGYGTTNGSTVQGQNCYMVVGSTSTTVYLTTTPSNVYTCVYTVDGVSRQIPNITGSVFSIPVGAGTSFSMFCAGYSGTGMVASATYTASASSSATHTGSSANANTPSSTKNLTLTAKSSSTTTVSWTKNSSATMYEVDYIRIGATTTEPIYTTKTSVDIPMGKSVGFEVYVYAYVNGRPVEVGNAIHKAGDEIGATTTTKPAETTKDEPKLSAYVTGFKGTVGTSGSITLAWNAASGNPNYEVYYKKSTASSWKRIYTTAGRALKVNKLTNGTSYDFKVVANGRDSGILTMTIGTTSSTKTAPDPDGSGSTGSATPVITSITGGTGTITVSWSAASGAVKYQVWVNPEGSTKYTKKATVDGTSATVTGLSAGSYKVRIKASKDGTTWGTFNDASCIKSDYRTVDVK